MPRVFVIGVTGGIGSSLAAQLLTRGDQPVGLHRHTDQAGTLRARGVEPVLGDLTSTSADALGAHLEGADAVIFTPGASGAGPEQADAVDGRGVVIAAAAAAAAGIRRFMLVSAFPDAWRDRGLGPAFEHYMRVKREADVHPAAHRS